MSGDLRLSPDEPTNPSWEEGRPQGFSGVSQSAGLGSPGPAEPGTSFRAAASWTRQAETWGPVLCLKHPWLFWDHHKGGSSVAPRPLELVLRSVLLTGHQGQPGLQGQFTRLRYFPGPLGKGSGGLCARPGRGGDGKGNR